MLEVDIQRDILAYLKLLNIFCWRNNTTGIYDPKKRVYRRNNSINGISDILGVLPDGRFLAIEVKRPGQYASKDQKEFMKNINDNGGLAFIAKSVKDVQDKFSEELKKSA